MAIPFAGRQEPILTVAQPAPLEPVGQDCYKTWVQDDGSTWAEFYRDGAEYLIRFVNLADFRFDISHETITCHPAIRITDHTVEHLFLNQVRPLFLGARGQLVLHASAVDVGGKAILFVGASGRGKSTLSTHFASNGHVLVSDDGIVFADQDASLAISPGHRSIRLWPDSLAALLPQQGGDGRQTTYSRKSRIIAPPGVEFAEGLPEVAAVFHIAPPSSEDSVVVSRLTPREALAECLSHVFLLDDKDATVLAKHFEKLTTLAAHAPQFQVEYPRKYAALKRLRKEILRHCNGLET